MTNSKLRRVLLLGVASLGIGAVSWWLLRAGALPILPPMERLSDVNGLSIAIFSVLWLLVLSLKFLRWHWQLVPLGGVPLRRVMSASLLGNAGLVILPLRSGELMRPALIARNSKVSFLAAVSTSAAERIADALFASVVLLGALSTATIQHPLPERIGNLPVHAAIVPTLGYATAGLSLTAVIVVVLFYVFRTRANALLVGTLGRLSPRLAVWVEHKLTELARGLDFLASFRSSGGFLGITALYWLAHWVSTWYLLREFGFSDITWAQAGVLLGTLSFGLSVPNSPGFFGIFQISAYASLAVFFPASRIQSDGAEAVFWMYVLELGWIFALCPLAAWVELKTPRRSVGRAQ